MNAYIDINTLTWYISMTQSKPLVNTIDRLIESGNTNLLISWYVELIKLREWLLVNPNVVQVRKGSSWYSYKDTKVHVLARLELTKSSINEIDVSTLVRYITMTQKKAPDNVDKLIESGDIALIISRYVELTIQANKLKKWLLLNPDIDQILPGLLATPTRPDMLGDFRPTAVQSPWGTPQATMQMQNIVPGVEEPLGTIHRDIPSTFEYPMGEDVPGAAQDAVIGMLQTYQGIDPQGKLL